MGADQGDEAGQPAVFGDYRKHISLIINDVIPVICNPTFKCRLVTVFFKLQTNVFLCFLNL